MWIKDKFSVKYLSFEEFCLSESLRPMSIDYGTDLKNELWHINGSIYWTFIKYNEYYYCIVIDDGQIGFAAGEFFDGSLYDDFNNVVRYFDFEERKTSSAVKVFAYIFYVILQGTQKYNLNKFWFSAQHPALGNVYQRMVDKNPYFMDSVKKAGFEYMGQNNGKYEFKRTKGQK